MHRRQSLPRISMMTDERQDDGLLPALSGMDSERARTLGGINIYGWAAIDAWEG